jgi:diacylglycerol kinase family enzyme
MPAPGTKQFGVGRVGAGAATMNPIPQKQRVVAFLNPLAGTIERRGAEMFRDALTLAFERRGISAQIEFLPGIKLRSAVERARDDVLAGKLNAVVVGGGDGSIRTAASALSESRVPLGILPLGTLNHFARDLHIPFAIDEAIAVIAAGHAQAVDVGEVNGETFINNSSIGIYPYIVLDRERRRRKQGLDKWAATFFAVLRTFRNFPLHRLIVKAAGLAEPCRTPCVFVGNNEYDLTVPKIGTRERLDRGELCLYVARPQSRLSLLWLAFRCMLGRIEQARDLRIFKVTAAEITSRNKRLLVAFDGEIETMRQPLRYRVRPGALLVLVPPPVQA